MPYTVALPDGREVEFPDNISKEQAANVIRKQFNFGDPETTITGSVKEAFKGLVPGAVNLVESAVTGASAMLPAEYEQAARGKTAEVAKTIKAPFTAAPGYEESVGRKFGEALGSTGPLFALGPLGLAGRAAMVGTGVAAGAGEARKRAEESGATEEQRRSATGLGAVVGSTEALPVFSFLNKLGKPAADALLDKVRRAAITGGQEGAQEIVSAALQNAIAKGIYKPDQSIIEGTGEAGAYGAGVGAFIQGVTDMALGRRARGPTQTSPAEAPIDVATREQAALDAQAPQARKVLPENDLYGLASGPSGYAEVAKYKAGLLEGKQTAEVKAAVKEATALLKLMDVEEYNRTLEAKRDIDAAVKERGLPTAETSAFNAPIEETPAVPEPKVRKKGAKDVAQPDVVGPRETAAIEPDGAGATVASMGVDSQPDADTTPVQTEATGVGVSELPTTDGNEPQRITGASVKVGDEPFTIVAHTDNMFALQDEMGNVTRAMRTGKLGQAIEAQLGIEPTVETPAAVEAPATTVETPAAVEAPAATVEPSTDPFAALAKQTPVLDAVETPLEPTESLDSLNEQRDSLRDSIAADKKSQTALRTPGGALLPAKKAGYDELQNSINQTQQKLDAIQDQIKLAKKTGGRGVAPTQAEQIARNKEWFKEKGQQEKPEGAKELIQQVAEAVGAYNNPASDVKRRYVATDFLYSVATEPNQKPSVKQFALQALRNAVDPMDMRPSLRPKYNELVKNVGEDTTNWGSYRYNQTVLNNAIPTTEKFTAAVASGQTRKALQTLFADKNAHPLVKLVAERMLKAGTLPKVSVVPANSLGVDPKDPDKYRAGVYDAVSDSILLDERGVNGPNLMHEVMHGFLHRKIVEYTLNGRPDAQIKRIDDLYQTLKKNNAELVDQYGMTNLSEFTSEAMSNPEFQDLLKNIPYKKGSFYGEFAKAVLKFFGITDTTKNWNALSEALISTESAMLSGRALQEVRVGTEMKGPSTPAVIANPGASAAAKQADVIGESADPTFTENMKQILGGKLNRSYLTDKLNSIDKKLTAGYAGRLFDALGNINPSELLAQALDATRVVERSFIEGFLDLTPDGMFTATTGKLPNGDAASLKSIFDLVNSSAKQSGNTLDQERKVLSSLLVGHREFELDKYNNLPTTPVAIELRIKDANKRNELERQFQANPDAQKVLKIMDAMRFNRIDMMVAAGRISQDKANFWKSTTGYVPFQDMEALASMAATQKVGTSKGLSATAKYKRIEGGDQKVGDSIDSFVDLMSRMSMDAIKTNAVSKAAQSLTKLGHAKRISPAVTLSGKQLGHILDTYVNGVPARFYFTDPLDAAAFAGMPGEISTVVSAAQQFSRVLRAGVTLVPGFAVGQVLQDISRAYALSDVANPKALIPRILMNFPRAAFGELTGRKSAAVTRMENMGVMATFDVSTRGTVKNILQEVGAEKRGLVGSILHVGEAISKGSDIAVRKAIYEQSMKETGGNEALSMSRAREIINFSRRGNSKVVDFFVRTVPFTNAYIRGMDKLYTAATGKGNMYGMSQAEARGMFRNRILTLSAIGFTYALMMAGDEEYEALDDTVRDTRFVFPSLKLGEAPVAIPLPRDLAFIFKAIPERVVNYFRKYGTDEEKSGIRVIGELMKQGVGVIAAPNLTPTAILPVLENIANYSFFLDRALESQSQMGKESFMAYGRGTSEVSKALSEGLSSASKALSDVGLEGVGSAIEVSPVKLENLFRGLLGTSASLALAIGDELIAPDRTDKPTHRGILAQLTGASAIMVDPVGRRQLNAFFDMHEKLSKVNNTLMELEKKDPEKAIEYGSKHVPELNVYAHVEGMYKDIQELNKTVREVDADKSMSPEERMKIIANIVRDQNIISKDVDSIKTYLAKSR